MKTRPELLLHDIIPPPLHGIAPRVVLGDKWWDTVRKKAYAENDDCCWTCGIHKSQAAYKKYLEGHESYTIDYDSCTVILNEVVALCNSCHNFIHVGRLISQLNNKVVSERYVSNVLDKGIGVLKAGGLKPRALQAIHWLIYTRGFSVIDAIEYVDKADLAHNKFRAETWDLWKLVIGDKEYLGKSQLEWTREYEILI